jgi:hypothetical protein
MVQAGGSRGFLLILGFSTFGGFKAREFLFITEGKWVADGKPCIAEE